MSREPTTDQLLVLATLTLEQGCYGQGIKRVTPADRMNAAKVALIVEDDGDDWLFRTFDRIPVTQEMGS